jgi:hypothetical protein
MQKALFQRVPTSAVFYVCLPKVKSDFLLYSRKTSGGKPLKASTYFPAGFMQHSGITLEIPNNLILEVQVEDEDKGTKGVQHSLEIEIKWYDNGPDGSLELK